MKINVRKLAKTRAVLKTIGWFLVAFWIGSNCFRVFLSIKYNLEEIKTLQVIQLKYSKRIVCEVADD